MAKRVARYGRLGPLYELLPRKAYLTARNVWLDLKSIPVRLSGEKPGPLPWLTLHNYGDIDFYESGAPMVDALVGRAGLTPTSTILDIGCGSGRFAWPLTTFLASEGGYIGFDVSKPALGFARKLTTARRPDFVFHHADLFSAEYNPRGAIRASDYDFPCEDGWADVIVASSVFTHLLEADAAHFLKEIARCLKPGGRADISAYLVDEEIRKRMENSEAMLIMQRYEGPVWAGDMATPEAATGYDEDAFLAMIADAGLTLAQPIIKGGWSHPPGVAYTQDMLVLQRA